MIFETHAHICDAKYDADREEMLVRAEAAGVSKFINIGAEVDETRKVAAYDRQGVYKSLGLHPHYVEQCRPDFMKEMRGWLGNGKNIAAVGEIGLDYFRNSVPAERQKQVFRQFLGLAKEFNLPAIIHSREAHDDVLEILDEAGPGKKGVIHCFSGSYETAVKFIDRGYMLGIGGVITFPNAKDLREAVSKLPLECLVLETDAPWLAPQRFRGKRNEPAFLVHIAAAIAEIKGIEPEQAAQATACNAERMFGI